MNQLIESIINGISFGLLYGLLAFSIVLLFKSNGVANFAQGNVGAFAVFISYVMYAMNGWNFWLSIVLAIVAAAVLGIVVYFIVLGVNGSAGPLNATMRTMGLYLLLYALMNQFWAVGQPFSFHEIFPRGNLHIGGVSISYTVLGTLGVVAVLLLATAAVFRYTRVGLLLRGLAANASVARLLGLRTARYTAVGFAISSVVAVIAGLLIAPTVNLTSDMLEIVLPYSFTAVILGGITSLGGSIIGGLIVGIAQSVTAVYLNSSAAAYVVFGVLVATLLIRPSGIFGRNLRERF
ncbi:MAG TPA: branched-chain amino acid ABC transporter permease [Rhodopila sp.]